MIKMASVCSAVVIASRGVKNLMRKLEAMEKIFEKIGKWTIVVQKSHGKPKLQGIPHAAHLSCYPDIVE